MPSGMGDGWGDLREIREGPTPTAGLQRGCHCNVPTTLGAYRGALRSAIPLRYGHRCARYRLSALPNFPYHARSPSLYQRHTIAVPSPYQGRFMFGFRHEIRG